MASSTHTGDLANTEPPTFAMEEAVVQQELRRRLFARSSEPVRVGRYAIEAKLGSGGMGEVYVARDEELGRAVAIKVLRPGRSNDADDRRLIREARAMARITHPNVARVFDAGTHRGSVYIAMELIEGQTLRSWIVRAPRTWREVVSVFLAAARGLAAAHAQGLMHGDFKPDNVMLELDERGVHRVCVLDFGLARTLDGPLHSGSGLRGGTLHYAAPEVLARSPTDARADQFSFCVSLFEALYGCRPFDAESPQAVVASIREGGVVEIPRGRAPRALLAVVRRGLAADPADRYPSVDALGSALAGVGSPRGRWLSVLVGGGVIAAALASIAPTESCEGAADELAGIWDDQRRAEVGAAMLASEVPYARDMWSRVRGEFDAYAERWVQLRTQACEVIASGDMTTVVDHQIACLRRGATDLQARVDALGNADVEAVGRAFDLAPRVSTIERCMDAGAFEQLPALPRDPRTRAEAQRVQTQIARVKALHAAGRFAASVEVAERALASAERTGDPALIAEAALAAGVAHQGVESYETAVELETHAYVNAVACADSGIAGRAATVLARVLGYELARPKQGLDWARIALAEAEKSDDQYTRWRALQNIGIIERERGEPERARAAFDEALALIDDAGELGDRHRGDTLGWIALALLEGGQPEKGLEAAQQGVAMMESAYPAEHPRVGNTHATLANTLNDLSRRKDAIVHYRIAYGILKPALGSSPEVARVSANMGQALALEGETEEGIRLLLEAEQILSAELGPDHPHLGHVAYNLGTAYSAAKDDESALQQRLRAVEIFRASYGDRHLRVGAALYSLARTLGNLGRHEEALEVVSEAVAVLEDSLGRDRAMTLQARVIRADILAHLSRPLDALAELEAVKAPHEAQLSASWQARLDYQLARALWDTGKDRPRALRTARGARERYAAAGFTQAVAKVDAWLAERE